MTEDKSTQMQKSGVWLNLQICLIVLLTIFYTVVCAAGVIKSSIWIQAAFVIYCIFMLVKLKLKKTKNFIFYSLLIGLYGFAWSMFHYFSIQSIESKNNYESLEKMKVRFLTPDEIKAYE